MVKPRIIGSSPIGVDAFTVNRGGYNIGCYVEELLTEITPMATDIALIISVYALPIKAKILLRKMMALRHLCLFRLNNLEKVKLNKTADCKICTVCVG